MRKLLLILLILPLFTNAQNITTVAGNGTNTTSGDGGPAIAAGVVPNGICFDKYGNMYVACYTKNVVRKITPAGMISTVAGDIGGAVGYTGDGGPATAALLNYPFAVAADTADNLYICDARNNVVRKITAATGIISTFAGDTGAMSLGDGGLADTAALGFPYSICIDKYQNVFIADYDDSRIRKVNSAGIITTVVGNGTFTYSGDGGRADTAGIALPESICMDGAGNMYFNDNSSYRIRKVDTFGFISTIAGNGTSGFASNGVPATTATINPSFITCDKAGNIFTSDRDNRVRMINTSGTINTIAGISTYGFSGDGGPADTAEIHTPHGLTVDTCGNLYFCDFGNYRVRKIAFGSDCYDEGVPVITRTGTINIYPNPATDILNIEVTGAGGSGQIAISNLLGQLVYTQAYNKEKLQIDVSMLPVGIYLVRINNAEVRKFVKE